MTPTQKYLKSLKACGRARTWVGERTPKEAWDVCGRLDWMQWLITAVAKAEYERVTTPARAECDRVTTPARAEYDRVTAVARACKTCDEFRSKFSCPEVHT